MLTIANSTQSVTSTPRQLTDVRTTLIQSLLDQNPGLKLIDAQVKRDDTRLSTYGKLALALDNFRAQAAGLTGGKLGMVAVASGTGVTAKVTASSATGAHTVDVQQLSQSQKLATRAVTDKDAAIGSDAGSVMTVVTGTGKDATSTTVRIGAGQNTLDGIARAMRDAGLDAQVGPDGKGGHRLELTGKTGAASTMRINVAGDPVLQAMFAQQPGNENGLTQTGAAQDARAVINGKTVSSADNTLESAIPGLTLSLTAIGKSEVGVRADPAAIATNIKEFVTAFNTLNSTLDGLKTGDTKSDTAALKMKSQLGSIVDGVSARQLAEMGITRNNGALVLDEAKLKATLTDKPDLVTQVFSDRGGLAERMTSQIDRQLGAGGILATEAAGVLRERDKLLAQKTRMIESVGRQASFIAQYQTGTGGSLMFGNTSLNRPMSLFDYMA
jgi:flagellar hook-associated protein 2